MKTYEDLRMGTDDRLWELIEERAQPGANVEQIDRHVWELFGEDWAIVFTDLAGFSRKAEKFGIIHFLQVIFESKRLLFPIIRDYRGFLVKAEADSCLFLFRSPVSAVQCMIEAQRSFNTFNERRVDEEKALLCAGVGFGRMLRIGEHDVWGQEVNAASKLGEDTASAGEILVTDAVRAAASDTPGVSFETLHQEVAGSPKNYRLSYEL